MTEWLYLFLFGFTFFLLGFSIFMYFEEKKFGDNQFTMKLLPPPMPAAQGRRTSGSILEKHRA